MDNIAVQHNTTIPTASYCLWCIPQSERRLLTSMYNSNRYKNFSYQASIAFADAP